jgi:hypothetical protein
MQLPNAFARFCARHILGNIKGGAMSKACRDLYWVAVKSETKRGFDEAMCKLNALHSSAYKYLHAIPHELWANYAFPSPLTHEYYTNNLSERAFAWLGEDLRGKPPVPMLKDLLSRLGEQHHNRKLNAMFLRQNKVWIVKISHYKSLHLDSFLLYYRNSQLLSTPKLSSIKTC